MNEYIATEIAYKNGYAAGIKDCLKKVLTRFDIAQKAIILSKEDVYSLAGIFNINIEES
jgi:hypothetical protein